MKHYFHALFYQTWEGKAIKLENFYNISITGYYRKSSKEL